MDFGGLPPEIKSARMYAGPGPESMVVAAASWNALAAELRSAASSNWQGTSMNPGCGNLFLPGPEAKQSMRRRRHPRGHRRHR
jgi:hypothetical protein